MSTPFTKRDIERLKDLRATLLGIEGRPDGEPAPRYWDADSLRLYDQVFATRIAWKWDAVLDEVVERAPAPLAPRTVLDFASGTGIAVRTVLTRIPAPERVVLVDRDEAALEFARAQLAEDFPDVEVETRTSIGGGSFDLALASHVLDELDDEGASALMGILRGAHDVLWVEPGSKITSRRLSAARDALLDAYDVIAPCTHRASCGMLAAERRRDWCHLFAKPPGEVHTTAEWSQIGRELGIDLRSLPYAFLALTRREVPRTEGAPRRVLGRPRLQRGRVLLDVCGPDGVEQTQILQREHKDLYKALKKDGTVLRMEPEG